MTVIIGDKPLSDWGYVTYYDLGVPEIDEKKQDIPGRNGSLDYTEALTGFPTYKNRPITIKMSITKRNPREFREVMSEIRNFCHGQKKKIIFPDDDTHYYQGRCSVSEERIDAVRGDIEISIDAEPYALNNSITEITGSGALELINESMPTVVSIECTNATNIVWGEKTYGLDAGEHTIDKILPPGTTSIEADNEVIIKYQEGRL